MHILILCILGLIGFLGFMGLIATIYVGYLDFKEPPPSGKSILETMKNMEERFK